MLSPIPILLIVLFIIYLTLYEQTADDYRINQLTLQKLTQNRDIFLEGAPIVITEVPVSPVWTINDIRQRSIPYNKKPINFADAPPPIVESRKLGTMIGADIWLEKILEPFGLARIFMKEIRATWGRRGLIPVHAWTAVILTEGSALASLIHRKADKFLPPRWRGMHPADITVKHTPFISDIKYMDIVLRPGTVLMIPPHWRMAVEPTESVGTIIEVTFHHPMSLLVGSLRGY